MAIGSDMLWANVISIKTMIKLAEAVGGESEKFYLFMKNQVIVKLLDTVDALVVVDVLNQVKNSITKILCMSLDQKDKCHISGITNFF